MSNARKTPTKEMRAWMKENGYTEAQIDDFWNDCASTNSIVSRLIASGKSWRDMSLSCVMELPFQKEKDLKRIAEQEAEKIKKEEAERKAKEEKEYYLKHFSEIMVRKIDNHETLTENELKKLVCNYSIDTEYGENDRWTRPVTTVVKLMNRYFSVEWEEGLTEYQENEFYNQPIEVYPHEYQKTIIVREWLPIKHSEL